MLFVSSTPSKLEQNLRDFLNLKDFCPNLALSGQNLNFNLKNRQTTYIREYPTKIQKIQKNYKIEKNEQCSQKNKTFMCQIK